MKKRNKVLLMIAGVWLFAMLATTPEIIAAWRERGAVQQTFSAYSDALIARDFERAYAYHSAEFQKVITLNNFVKYQQGVQTKFGVLNSIDRRGVTLSTWKGSQKAQAVVIADFHYARSTVRFTCNLRRENSQWVILRTDGDER